MSEPVSPIHPTTSELQRSLSEYSQERERLLAAIHKARGNARKASIEAATCHQPIPQATIDRWQRDIKEKSAELLALDGKIGAANKALRALRAANNMTSKTPNNQAIKSLAQLPKPKVEAPLGGARTNNEPNSEPKQGRIMFLEFFYQLASENVDPRLIAVWERDAHSLVGQYKSTHGWEEES
jgi:hypothetical protein